MLWHGPGTLLCCMLLGAKIAWKELIFPLGDYIVCCVFTARRWCEFRAHTFLYERRGWSHVVQYLMSFFYLSLFFLASIDIHYGKMFEPRWNLEGKEVVRQFFGPKRFCFKKVADKLSEISRWGWWSRAICKAAPISAHYEKEAYVLKPARSQPTTLLKTPWVAASVETGVNHNDREETLSRTPHPSVVKRREINGIWKASKLARFHVGVDVWHRRPSEGFTSKGNPPTPTDRPT